MRRPFAVVFPILLLASHVAAQEEKTPAQPDVWRVFPLLKGGKYAELEAELSKIVARGRATGDLTDPLDAVVADLVSVPTIRPLLDDWCRNKKSASSLLARGRFYVDFAWEARGSGFADTVTPEGWKLFKERLLLAKADLEGSLALDPKRPHAAAELETVAVGLSLDRAELEKYFAAAIKADPKYLPAYDKKLMALMPKWGGSEEELLAFAEKCAKDPDPALALVLVDARIELSHGSANAKEYLGSELVKGELDKILARALEAYPRSPHVLWAKLTLAQHRGDTESYSRTYEELGELGNPRALLDLAQIYYDGVRVTKDLKRAARYVTIAAHAGDPLAQFRLGDILSAGLGVEQDWKEAIRWFGKAAELDNIAAHSALAAISWRALGGAPHDAKKVLAHGTIAAEHGNLSAMKFTSDAATELGDLETGERWIRRYSEHNDGLLGFLWYYWCKDNGRGNLAAARERGLVAARNPDPAEAKKSRLGTAFFLIEASGTRSALGLLRELYEAEKDPFFALHIALATESVAERKAMLEAIAASKSDRVQLVGVASLLEGCWREDTDPSPEAVKKLLENASDKEVCNANYFLACFLEQRKKVELARGYYAAAVATSYKTGLSHKLSREALERLGKKPTK